MKQFISVLSALGLAVAALIAAPTVASAQSAYFGTIGVAAIADMWLGEIGSDDPQSTLPGGTYEGLAWTAWDGADWSCVSLNDFPWFAGTSDVPGFNSLTQTGLSDRFTEEMDQEGTWSETARHCIALKQLTAADGHGP
ncbi:hypothetical protein EG850_06665 [Gulosibacter macacae]|uniref:Secreted protein n=1 Tax=Gulosibacter macacae TaxID=2488791 RepID=A0A3P3VXJ1_9MICO|nr:hypothetical protein [Gulosibacter macacae]RRJ87077.1 hypothetical protein EG850_06665 [Gulosibacter macacae]